MRVARHHEGGFTLIELLVSVLIITLVLGALLVPLSTQFNARRYAQAEADLADIREALIGFAIANGRLPCPDNLSNERVDGLEDFSSQADVWATPPDEPDDAAETVFDCNPLGTGDRHRGYLPFATLGTVATDPWGRYYRYRVRPGFSTAARPGSACAALDLNGDAAGEDHPRVTFCAVSELTLMMRGDEPGTVPEELRSKLTTAQQVAAVVFSTGENGRGGRLPNGTVIAIAEGDENHDEACNAALVEEAGCGPFSEFFVGPPRTTGVGEECQDVDGEGAADKPLCAFDDVITWIPTPELLSRLNRVGWLP